MIGMLTGLLVRICLAMVTLALRLAIALASLVLHLLAYVIGRLWRNWHRPEASQHMDGNACLPPRAPIGWVRSSIADRSSSGSFTPRPLRRRPGR